MVAKIKLTFLGTADAIPSAQRNHSAMLLQYDGENILIDCGEGTQRQFRKAGLNPCKVTRILISHWHGDHVLGLPGLLQTLALSGYHKTLYIYGPRGTKKFVGEMLDTFAFERGKYKIIAEDVSGKFLEMKKFYLEAEKLSHGIPANAYNFVKKGLVKIDKKKLKKSGLSEGSILSKLKQGKDISFNGKKFKAKDLTYKEEDRKISFILDTKLNDNLVKFARGAELLISESSFSDDDSDKAREHLHLTAGQAAGIAKKAKVGKLVLTHISQRYEKNLKKILTEAKKVFKNSGVVKDLDVVEL